MVIAWHSLQNTDSCSGWSMYPDSDIHIHQHLDKRIFLGECVCLVKTQFLSVINASVLIQCNYTVHFITVIFYYVLIFMLVQLLSSVCEDKAVVSSH